MKPALPVNQIPVAPLEDELTQRQRAFVNHPMILSNPELAAREAGYSESYAKSNAWTLRKQLKYFINQKSYELGEWINVDAAETLAQIGAVASSNILNYFEYVDTEGGSRLQVKENLKALPQWMQASIKKIEFETIVLPSGTQLTVMTKLELHDKMKAVDLLADIHKLKVIPTDKRNTDALKGMTVAQLQRLEDTMAEITSEVRAQGRAAREKEAIDVEFKEISGS
jgi:phage terminase small subunit